MRRYIMDNYKSEIMQKIFDLGVHESNKTYLQNMDVLDLWNEYLELIQIHKKMEEFNTELSKKICPTCGRYNA